MYFLDVTQAGDIIAATRFCISGSNTVKLKPAEVVKSELIAEPSLKAFLPTLRRPWFPHRMSQHGNFIGAH